MLNWPSQRSEADVSSLQDAAFTCEVCGRTSRAIGEWAVVGIASGGLVGGLDPQNCAGCHDVMTSHGVVPRIFNADGSSSPIPRPES